MWRGDCERALFFDAEQSVPAAEKQLTAYGHGRGIEVAFEFVAGDCGEGGFVLQHNCAAFATDDVDFSGCDQRRSVAVADAAESDFFSERLPRFHVEHGEDI
ncbi:MAG: hypothetical protein RL215_1107 [Planctomycetota bacterium]